MIQEAAKKVIGKWRLILPDRAVGYGMANTLASAVTMPATVLLVGKYLTPPQQGLFYTFGSVLALQIFFEMGFSQCLVQFISHESSKFKVSGSELIGVQVVDENLGRIAALGSIAKRWYACVGILTFVVIGPVGHIFFRAHATKADNWMLGWWGVCIGATLLIAMQPKLILLEGLQQVESVNKIRFYSSVVRLAVLVSALAAGAGLLAPAIAAIANSLVSIVLCNISWSKLFAQIDRGIDLRISRFSIWKTEIWDLQWRMSLSWAAGYFIYNAFNPLLLHYQGAVEAGRFGMTWSIIQGLSSLATIWGIVRIPTYGKLVAQRKWDELDLIWRRSSAQSLVAILVGVVGFIGALVAARSLNLSIVERVGSLWIPALLGLGAIANQVVFAQAFFLRSHKKEPFLALSLIVAVATLLGLLVAIPSSGAVGAAGVYGLVTLLVSLPLAAVIFKNSRSQFREVLGAETKP